MERHTKNYNTVTKEENVGQSDLIHNERYSSKTKVKTYQQNNILLVKVVAEKWRKCRSEWPNS